MRNAVLSILVDVLAYNREEISANPATAERSAMLREELLDILFNYMRDANAVVRAKVN